MYLKSIEVQGFKSFANKMKFQFHNGITGIVGPNGSGKSNVADAVRWVLGEQSARQLRGTNMQDVIFSGTENRKPLGFASVAITLDNADHQLPASYEELTVTRRLYRSGESEYLMNGTACRLRDIQEMFYDTGIGKEGYSIIGQGQIDKILSGKPEERRELFDEAAGIVKYKRRKLTTLKKLENENNNLTRVNDILAEITRQLGPLERQSEKAKVYLKKKEELKSLDISMFLLDDRRIRGQLADVDKKLEISDQDLADVRGRLESARAEYEAAEQELEKLDQEIAQKQETLHKGAITRQQLESQIGLLEEQIRSAKTNDAYYEKRLKTLDADIQSRQEQIRSADASLSSLKEELDAARRREQEQEKLLKEAADRVQDLEQKIALDQAAMIDLLNERSNTQAKLQRYDTMKEQTQIRGAELTSRLLTAKGEEADLDRQEQACRENHDKIVRDIASMVEQNSAIERRIQNLQEKLAEGNRAMEEARTAYHRDASRLESLRNITERYDGYGTSIRRVMEKKDTEKGLHGVVADLIRTEKKYETAIETALGGSIQNIVTADEETAKRMIEYLKQNRFGRATFLPLTDIRKRGGLTKEQALYEPGAVGVASTLVDADEQYEQLVEYLLGQTLVADNIDHAVAIARKYKHSIRIVTLEGELLSPGGSMSGGAFKNASNLLGRRREVEDLEKAVAASSKKLDEAGHKIEEIRQARAALRQELMEQTQKLQQQYILQNTAKLKLDEISEQRARTLTGHGQLENEIREIDQQMKEIGAEQEHIQAELKESRRGEKELEGRILESQKLLEEERRGLEEQNGKTASVRTDLTAIGQRKEFLQDDRNRICGEISSLEQEKRQIEDGRADSGAEVVAKEEQIRLIRQNISAASRDEEAMQAQIASLTEKRRNASEVHRGFFEKREELADQMSALDKEHFRLENQKERLEDYHSRQVDYIWEEYGMTASEADRSADADPGSPAQLKKRIGELKNEIKNLGPVNVNAIEEYRETAERHAFLSAQHDDLVKAGEALKNIIRELDAGMRKQFAEQFARMQTEFGKAFKELFGGGKGTLELVEDEDILEAGIRIIAQPPGKKLQNMMQMSGGEKALTAIALLFAIQNMKPSPFCLLDEIEAALDENNVVRYANYLKKLTKNTQFIIITHRRGTMAAADRLYGITMQEKGVSTQVSVNMVEGQLDE